MKELYWIGSSLDDLKRFPQAVRQVAGYGLYLAQQGDTYRAVYTVAFKEVVYVLHAFQKKSKRGIATPKREIEQIKNRLRRATEHYRMLRGRNND